MRPSSKLEVLTVLCQAVSSSRLTCQLTSMLTSPKRFWSLPFTGDICSELRDSPLWTCCSVVVNYKTDHSNEPLSRVYGVKYLRTNLQQIYNSNSNSCTTSPQHSTKSYSLLYNRYTTDPQLIEPSIERVQACTRRHLAFPLCCHGNVTRAPIANSPNSAQLGSTPYHSPKLHPGLCSSVGMQPRTDTQTDSQTHRLA